MHRGRRLEPDVTINFRLPALMQFPIRLVLVEPNSLQLYCESRLYSLGCSSIAKEIGFTQTINLIVTSAGPSAHESLRSPMETGFVQLGRGDCKQDLERHFIELLPEPVYATFPFACCDYGDVLAEHSTQA